jgi:hypothetical protein
VLSRTQCAALGGARAIRNSAGADHYQAKLIGFAVRAQILTRRKR